MANIGCVAIHTSFSLLAIAVAIRNAQRSVSIHDPGDWSMPYVCIIEGIDHASNYHVSKASL